MKKKIATRLLLFVEILIMVTACVLSADFITWLVNNTGSTGWYNLLDAVIVLAAAFILIVAMMVLGIVILKFDKASQEQATDTSKETNEETEEQAPEQAE